MADWSAWFRLTIGILATWRVTHLIAREDGPWDLIVRVRARAGSGMFGQLMDCPYCLSLWIAAPVALLSVGPWPARAAFWLAISGGASIIERSLSGLEHRR